MTKTSLGKLLLFLSYHTHLSLDYSAIKSLCIILCVCVCRTLKTDRICDLCFCFPFVSGLSAVHVSASYLLGRCFGVGGSELVTLCVLLVQPEHTMAKVKILHIIRTRPYLQTCVQSPASVP